MKRIKFIILFVAMMAFPMIQNCGGTSKNIMSDIIVADRILNDGWDSIKLGNYLAAQKSFEQAIKEPLTEAQRVAAHNGMGWALSKNNKILEAIPYFEIAAEREPEAKVGLAGALIFRNQTSFDYIRAAEVMSSIPPEKFAPRNSGLALNSGKVHALAALAYALAGDMPQAQAYMNKAAALDSMMIGTSVDKLDDAFALLGWKEE